MKYPISGWDLASFKTLVDKDAPAYSWIFNHSLTVTFIEPAYVPHSPFYNTKIGIDVAGHRPVSFLYHRLNFNDQFGDNTELQVIGNTITIDTIIREFGRVNDVQLTEMDCELSSKEYTVGDSTTVRISILPTSLVWYGNALVTLKGNQGEFPITEDGDGLITEDGEPFLFEGS